LNSQSNSSNSNNSTTSDTGIPTPNIREQNFLSQDIDLTTSDDEDDDDSEEDDQELYNDLNPLSRMSGRTRSETMIQKKSSLDGSGGENSEGTAQIEALAGIKGIITEYPLDFLCDDFAKLKTSYIPAEIFK
jgi:hypothetical protein